MLSITVVNPVGFTVPSRFTQSVRNITDIVVGRALKSKNKQQTVLTTGTSRPNDIGALEALIIIGCKAHISCGDDVRIELQNLLYDELTKVYPDLRFSVVLSFELEIDDHRFIPLSFSEAGARDLLDTVTSGLRVQRAYDEIIKDESEWFFHHLTEQERTTVRDLIHERPDHERFAEMLFHGLDKVSS